MTHYAIYEFMHALCIIYNMCTVCGQTWWLPASSLKAARNLHKHYFAPLRPKLEVVLFTFVRTALHWWFSVHWFQKTMAVRWMRSWLCTSWFLCVCVHKHKAQRLKMCTNFDITNSIGLIACARVNQWRGTDCVCSPSWKVTLSPPSPFIGNLLQPPVHVHVQTMYMF